MADTYTLELPNATVFTPAKVADPIRMERFLNYQALQSQKFPTDGNPLIYQISSFDTEDTRRANDERTLAYMQGLATVSLTFGPLYKDAISKRHLCITQRTFVIEKIRLFAYSWHGLPGFTCSEYIEILTTSLLTITSIPMRCSPMQAHLKTTHDLLTQALAKLQLSSEEDCEHYQKEDDRFREELSRLDARMGELNQYLKDLISERKTKVDALVKHFGVCDMEERRQQQKHDILEIMDAWIRDETPCPYQHRYEPTCQMCTYISKVLKTDTHVVELLRKRARTKAQMY